ncbi:DNA damage-inducible protein 1 [Cryptotrichosporon argae]
MKLTVIAPENVYEHDVDSSMEVRDLLALLEAETGVATHLQTLTTDSGEPMTAPERALASYGLEADGATIFVTFQDEPRASTSYAGAQAERDDDIERMRLQALGDPRVMAQLRQANPAFAQAIESGGPAFRQMMVEQQQAQRQALNEKERQIALLNADPYDVEAQKKIEEAIRMEAVLENMHHAMEYSPESFGHVTMLYINVEVNGHPVKAFVDSGAQTTIISPECAEACGIMRLLDKRFAGVAQGVGTANILGRIHSAQIKLGGLYLPVAFSVLEGRSVELLFGLDMLKRHQACIDLADNVLRIGAAAIPFLPEHELPDFAQRKDAQDVAGEMGQAAATGVPVSPKAATRGFPGAGQALGASSAAGPSGTSARAPNALSAQPPRSGTGPGAAGGFKQDDIDALVNLGASPDHAAELLRAAGGNVDVAASMLFG